MKLISARCGLGGGGGSGCCNRHSCLLVMFSIRIYQFACRAYCIRQHVPQPFSYWATIIYFCLITSKYECYAILLLYLFCVWICVVQSWRWKWSNSTFQSRKAGENLYCCYCRYRYRGWVHAIQWNLNMAIRAFAEISFKMLALRKHGKCFCNGLFSVSNGMRNDWFDQLLIGSNWEC